MTSPRPADVVWRDLLPLSRRDKIGELLLSLPWLLASLALAWADWTTLEHRPYTALGGAHTAGGLSGLATCQRGAAIRSFCHRAGHRSLHRG